MNLKQKEEQYHQTLSLPILKCQLLTKTKTFFGNDIIALVQKICEKDSTSNKPPSFTFQVFLSATFAEEFY